MSLSFWYKTLPNNVCSWIKFIRPKQGYLEDLRVLEDAGCEVVPTERNLKFCSYTVSMKEALTDAPRSHYECYRRPLPLLRAPRAPHPLLHRGPALAASPRRQQRGHRWAE